MKNANTIVLKLREEEQTKMDIVNIGTGVKAVDAAVGVIPI